MGRRLNVSTPTVIDTELVPLDESFYLDVDGQMEQWYYDNTEQYAPNRKVTPLLLVPVISAFDKDTSTSYTPLFNTTQWFANEWNEAQGKYVETEITNQVDSGSADYVIQGNNLLVKKNVSYSHAVSIRCVATYIDPRDRGVTYAVEDSVNLTTNRTADVLFPEVDIISPSGRAYNPLVDDENSQYNFKGVTTNNPVQPLNTDVRRYSVDVDGTEEILNSGEAVAPIMDIRYGNNPTMEDQEFMCRQTAGGTLVGESIDKAYIERIKGNTVAWNQLVQNGDFESTDGWTPSRGTISVSNNVLKYTIEEVSSNSNDNRVMKTIKTTSGHRYYNRYMMKSMVSGTDAHVLFLNSNATSSGSVPFAANTKTSISGIITSSYTGDETMYLSLSQGNAQIGNTVEITNSICIDLTLIYGEGNEPSTVAQFEADYERWFGKPLSYEEYDEGSLRPVLMQSIKTTGFNLWDEQWELGYYSADGSKVSASNQIRCKNKINVKGGHTIYVNASTNNYELYVRFYNNTGGYITTRLIRNTTCLLPADTDYILFYVVGISTYNHNICVNISNPSKNGTYEPYEEKVQGFDVTAIKGKLDGAGESVTIFPDGLKKAGDVQDEIFVENGVVKAIKRVGSVDLGDLDYAKYQDTSTYGTTFHSDDISNAKTTDKNIVCSIYTPTLFQWGAPPDDSCYWGVNGWHIRQLCIRDDSYINDDASTFKSAMQGVMLYYELAAPQTYVLDPITDFVWYGIKDGQEVLADTLPWYVSGQGTDNLVVDAMYGENINVVLRCKMMDGETLSPSKAYATLNWRTPDIETFVQSDNGGAVRSDTEDMTFDTIVNVNGDVVSDALKQKHLAFNWKIRKNNTSTEIDKGWGQRITIDASDLRNVKGSGSTLASTLVSNEVYLKGAYEEVTDNGEVVTYNGETVYDRPVD